MKKYIIKRLLQLIPILIGITLLTFVLMNASSTDAVDVMEQNTGTSWTEEQKEAVRAELGLDKPLPVQYLVWLGNLLRGDMGESYISGQPVFSQFVSKLPATIYLTITSILLTVILSIPLGILSAVRKNKFTDYLIRVLSFIGNSMPGFFVALLLMYVFSLKLGWFPVMGNNAGWKSVVLPTLTLAIAMSAKYTRQVQGNRTGRTEQRLCGWSALQRCPGKTDLIWKCIESIHADDRDLTGFIDWFFTGRNRDRGVNFYVGRCWKNGGRCHIDQRLSDHTGIRDLDGDYLCGGKSGDRYYLSLSGSENPYAE